MVGRNIGKVIIRTESSELFSTAVPTFQTNDTDQIVQVFGLAEIPSNAKLYVEVELKKLKSIPTALEMFHKLFPDYSHRSSNSFGMFLVS